MKTKLFSLFLAVILFSFSGNAQKTAKAAADFPVITLIGSGNGGWTDEAETPMLTSDGITYTLVDKVLTAGEVKFREGKCWEDKCPTTVGNNFGWGPTDAQYLIDGGWPSGVNAAPMKGGKNINSKAGSWTITFNRLAGSWSFVAGTPIPVVKLVGPAVSAVGGVTFETADGKMYTASKVKLVPGNCQFDVDGELNGNTTFPNGEAFVGLQIPITTTGVDYDVTFDFTNYKYTFKVATFPTIAIVGAGAGGWPTGAAGEVDANQMMTTDGETYTIAQIALSGDATDGKNEIKFRQNNNWDNSWGGVTFPTGPDGDGNIKVNATGNYSATFTMSTKAYVFKLNTYAIVGEAVGGWPGDPGNPGPIDMHQLSTVDGVNYTINNLVVTTAKPDGGAKFRPNNAWVGDWGGETFPMGTKMSKNIPTVAGTYNLTVNVITGAYDFGASLSTKNFTIAGLKTYPNPTQNNWNITANDQITSVQVFDILGKSVITKAFSSNEVSVSATKLSRGVYFAKISTAKGSSTVKLVKE